MPILKLAIFDLDGTLIDSIDDLTTATNHMLEQLGKQQLTKPEVRKLVGQGARRLVERALPGSSPEEIERGLSLFVTYNRNHIVDQTVLFPKVKEILAFMRHQGTRLAVVSNKNEALCRKVLDELGAADFFDEIMGADTLQARKPSPEPLLKILNDYGVDAGDAAIIGDSINDVLAGKGAGMTTVGCTYGYGGMTELEEADYLIDSFSEILELPRFTAVL